MRFALSVASLVLWATVAKAETVVILRPSSPSADVTQTLTLVRGELLSVGLNVTLAERTGDAADVTTDSVAWLEPFAASGVSAVIEAIANDKLEAVDVWIVKDHPQRFEVTRVAVDPQATAQPEMVALQTVEALRAGLLETDWAARKHRHEPVGETAAALPGAQASPTASERVGVELGAAGIMSFDGLGPALLPTVRAGWAATQHLLVQASAAGLGSRSRITTTGAEALVAQQFAVFGGRYRLRPNHRVWPFLGLAAGILHTTIEGQSLAGTTGHTSDRWSGVIDIALGTGVHLYGPAYITVAVQAQIAAPYVAISLLDTVGATSGRPNVLLTVTMGAWL